MDLSFILNELGEERDGYFGAIAPPIIQTSNFRVKKVDELRGLFADEYSGYLYSRGINPTVDILRQKLAALDGAEDALVFNSGAAAIFAGVVSQVAAGDHIISVREPYTWARQMFDQILPRFQVTTTYVDGTIIENFTAALQPNTRLIYLESPNSWTFALQDLAAVSALAREHGIVTICDNSYCTPLFQQPIALGVDLVLQSATKYISGHSDTVAGVLSGRRERIKKIFDSEYLNIGSGIQPFNAWLLIRGLRTLPARLERCTRTLAQVLPFLKQHPRIEAVWFPLDEDFPQIALARQQMKGACGLVTLVMKAKTRAEIVRFCERLQHILLAVSWGGHESLVIPRCASLQEAEFDANNQDHRLVRLYIGLEDADYLIADLDQALAQM
ncbi:MAG: aminotransferase class I/II-fold pyridoxal phosphate-dependent enzyme [Lewinellaceae bacterium]|nr:aminotransferase class I/II-fold pyridoxal phosphate-dependent enzyme [Lewinellaceae bacterium]